MQANTDRIGAEQLARVSGSFLRIRPRLLLPFGPTLLLLLWRSQTPRLQLVAIAVTFVCMLSAFTWEAQRARRVTVSPKAFCTSLVLTLGGLAVLCAFSGGSRSPFLPILFAPLGVAFAAFGKSRRTALVFLAFAGVLVVELVLNALGSATLPTEVGGVIAALAATLASGLLYFGITGLAGAYTDTAQKLDAARIEVIQSAAEQTASLQALGARVAHELKNPLSAIKGLVQLLHRQAATSETPLRDGRNEQRLSVVLEEVARMESILRDYLDFSRPLGQLEARPIAMRPFLSGLISLLEGEAADRDVRLELSCPELEAYLDPGKLKQALLNLAQNSLAAMPKGGQLRLAVDIEADRAGLRIALSDTGTGMSREVLGRVKEPYFSHRPGGTGLGVVIADGIIRQHGGTLEFESQAERGTLALIRLPFNRPAPDTINAD